MVHIPDEIMVTLQRAVSMEIGRHSAFIEEARRAPHAAQLQRAIENHEKYLAEAQKARQWLEEHQSWKL